MPSYNLGSIEGKIRISYDPSGTAQAKKDTADLKSGLNENQKAVKDVGTASLVAGGAVAGGLALAVKAASDFEKTLSAVKAVSGATTDQMEKLRAKAMQIGQDTNFSSSEAAGAMEELVKAGIKVEDVLNGAADATVSLAAAGGIDLPRAAEIASAAMNNFNLSAKDLPHVADLIAGAANSSAIDVADFGESLKQSGAVANLVGLNFDDLTLAITAMGNAGIKGSDAGTSLKTFLSNLQPSTKKQANLMNDLGITTKDAGNKFFDAAGHIKSMADIGGVLSDALKGMSDAQKQQTLDTLFGSDAIRAAAVIAKEGSAGFADLAKEISKTSAADVAKTRMDNFAGTMENLKGTLENSAITIGAVLIPVLRDLANILNTLVGWVNNLPKPLQDVLTWFLAISATLLLVNGTVIKLVSIFGNLIGSIKLVATAVSDGFGVISKALIANPWIAVVIAIIAVIALIIIYWDDIVAFLSKIWKFIADLATKVWGGIAGFFTDIWNAVTGAVKDAWNAIVTFLTGVWNWIVQNVWPILSPIVNIIKGILEVLFAIIQGIANLIAVFLEVIWKGIAYTATEAWKGLQIVLEAIWTGLSVAFHAVFDPIAEALQAVWDAVSTGAKIAWDGIVAGLTAAWNAVASVFTSIWDGIVSGIKFAWQAMNNSMGQGIRDAVNKIGEFVTFLGGLPGQALHWLESTGVNLLKGLLNGIISGLSWIKNKIIEFFQGIVDDVKDFFGISSPSKLFAELGGFTIQGYVVGVESMERELSSTMTAVLNPDMSLLGAQQVGMALATNALATPAVMAGSMASGTSSSSSNTVNIANLSLNVAGNLDPSNPTEFRQTIVNIKDALRQVDRDYA